VAVTQLERTAAIVSLLAAVLTVLVFVRKGFKL